MLAALPALAFAATATTVPQATTKAATTTARPATTTVKPAVVTSVKPAVTTTVRAYTTIVKGITTTIKGYTTVIPGATTTVTVTQRPATTTLTTTRRATTSTTPAKPATTTAKAAAAATAPSSPNLYPRLIVPVVNGQAAQGTQYFVTVNPNTKTDLLFDIAANSGYKTCTLVGRFPVGGSSTSSGAYGSGSVQAQLLASNINTATSAANQPAVKTNLGTQPAGTATNGANAVYSSFPVVAGQSYSIVLSAASGSIRFFEDYNAPVVGYTLNCV